MKDTPSTRVKIPPAFTSLRDAINKTSDHAIRRRPCSLSLFEWAVVFQRAEGKSLAEIGKAVGLSGSRIRQIENKAARKLVYSFKRSEKPIVPEPKPEPPEVPRRPPEPRPTGPSEAAYKDAVKRLAAMVAASRADSEVLTEFQAVAERIGAVLDKP